MVTLLARSWWLIVLRGIFAIIFGFLALSFSGLLVETLTRLFAAYVLVCAGLTVWSAIQHRTQAKWWIILLEGGAGFAAGIAALLDPAMPPLALLYIIAFWTIASGVLEVWAALELGKKAEEDFWLLLGGALSVVVGVLLILRPVNGALSNLGMIAGYAAIFGFTMIMLGYQLHGLNRQLQRRPTIEELDVPSMPVP